MKKTRVLITGGAGFIGSNAAEYFLERGYAVTVLDNLSRKGTAHNIRALQKEWPRLKFIKADVVTQPERLGKAVKDADLVIHLAAQVAVTTSVDDPHHDFLTNAAGTLHMLEAVRASRHRPFVIYISTNKVYGNMEDQGIRLTDAGYRYRNLPLGVSEAMPLDFHSPYGCSKGVADQYVRDYARIYGLQTVVFRQSCIYGPRQFGIEDQGWLAWFVIAGLLDKKVTIFGDGHQSRDVLFVRDLCRLYELAFKKRSIVTGKIYNVGGGKEHTHSVLRTIGHIETILAKKIPYTFSDWRPGDQKVYVSDIRRAFVDLGWRPRTPLRKGLEELVAWARDNKKKLQTVLR